MKVKEGYLKLDPLAGSTIDEVVKELENYNSQGKKVYVSFNGTPLYSDSVTLDSAYMAIMEKTKDDFTKEMEQIQQNLLKQEMEFKQRIPELTEEWKAKGREVLTEDKLELWDKVVPIRLNDLYQGFELGACLDVVKVLNNEGSFEEATAILDSQGHSGMSYGLVVSMIREFATCGKEFYKFAYNI